MELSLSLRVEENRIPALLRGTPHILPLAKGELEGVEFWRLLKKGGRKQ